MYLYSSKLGRLAGLALVVASLAGCDISTDGGFSLGLGSARAQDEWTRAYELAPGGRLEIVNINGRIVAEATESGPVEVRAVRTVRSATEEGAQELLERLEMREEVGDTHVRVEVRAPSGSGLAGGHQVEWTIHVPQGVHVDLRTVNGGVNLQGLGGEVRARATNGGIRGTGLRPSALEASVTNGGITMELVSAPAGGTFELSTVNGGVNLAVPADMQADIEARAVNGGVSVSDLDVVVQESTRRSMSGQLNGGGARISLRTTNGGVRLTRAG